jgi:enediyne biosynthesis protein E4
VRKKRNSLFLGLVVLSGFAASCQSPRTEPVAEVEPVEPPWFRDWTAEKGLHFQHDAGPPPQQYFMPQMIGSGAALFDFDGDGRLDIYLLQNGGPKGSRNRLYQQQDDGRFKDVSADSGLDIAGHNMGVAVGDANNDGRPDVLVTQCTGVKFFLNQGGGRFVDVTDKAGLRNPNWGASAAFVDFDRDGWLDLVVVNYVDHDPSRSCSGLSGIPDYCAPRVFSGSVSRLFHNRGAASGGRPPPVSSEQGGGAPRSPVDVFFEDVTVKSGLGRLLGPGLGVLSADFNGDGWPDIFIANDGEANRLWINQTNGTFKEEAIERGVAYNAMGQAEAGMGVAIGDVDGDGLFDLYVTHLTEESNRLWRQKSRGLFRDQTARAGLVQGRWHGTGFGTILGDFNLDGALDLAIVNGRVSKALRGADDALGPHWGLYAERNQLFINDGAGHFRDISLSNPDLCSTPNIARGLAYGDIDNDGKLDLLVTSVVGPARLYHNVASPGGHWLSVRAILPEQGGRDAVGAEIRVRAGQRSWLRWINPAASFLCSNDPRAHFGLGSAAGVDDITVLWPDGSRETFAGGRVDCLLTLQKGKGIN